MSEIVGGESGWCELAVSADQVSGMCGRMIGKNDKRMNLGLRLPLGCVPVGG